MHLDYLASADTTRRSTRRWHIRYCVNTFHREVERAAETRARQVLEAADADSRRLKNETEDFLDRRLASFEILLDRLTRTVSQGRERLSIVGTTPEPTLSADDGEDVSSGAPTFFDQDHDSY